jgi:hypothetical protein
MRKRVAIWAALVAIGIIAFGFLARPIPPTKARASRISGVNNLRSITLTLTNTNTLTGTLPAAGK